MQNFSAHENIYHGRLASDIGQVEAAGESSLERPQKTEVI
jgi:hypothetical protein